MQELIKQILIKIIGKSSGIWGLLINWLSEQIWKWTDILAGKQIDKFKGKKDAKEIKNAKTDSEINDAFDNLE